MRSRCDRKTDPAYPNYGGRGIRVCDRWQIFENFLQDMGPMPDGMELDRIDVNGHYEPGNCRWATVIEQARNKRNSLHIEFNGQTKCLKAWAEELGIGYHTLYRRVAIAKMPVEIAFTAPVMSTSEIGVLGSQRRWHKQALVVRGEIKCHTTGKYRELLGLPEKDCA